jgi:hypothetical protein
LAASNSHRIEIPNPYSRISVWGATLRVGVRFTLQVKFGRTGLSERLLQKTKLHRPETSSL